MSTFPAAGNLEQVLGGLLSHHPSKPKVLRNPCGLWQTKPDVIPTLMYVELIEEAEPTATRGHISCLDSSDEYQREEEQATLL